MAKEEKDVISLADLAAVAKAAADIARQGGTSLGISSLAQTAAGDALAEIIERIGRNVKEVAKNG